MTGKDLSGIDPGRKNCQDDQEVVFTLGYKERKNVTEMPESERYRTEAQSVAPSYTLQGGLIKIAASAILVLGMYLTGTCAKANNSVEAYQNRQEQARQTNFDGNLKQVYSNWESEARRK